MESFVWQDIIIVVDNGSTDVSEYDHLTATVNASGKFPNGFGLLSIIPEDSSPRRSSEVSVARKVEAMGAQLAEVPERRKVRARAIFFAQS